MFYFCFCVVVVVVVYYNLKYWVSKAGVLLMAGYQQSSATCKTLSVICSASRHMLPITPSTAAYKKKKNLIKTLIRWLCCLQFLYYRMQGNIIRIIM